MNKNQIVNIFIYYGIMVLDNQLIMTAPSYLKEKTLDFFGQLGKNKFINYPKITHGNQKLNLKFIEWNRGKHKWEDKSKNVHPNLKNYSDDFWKKYCKIWNVENDDYELMNIINFILSFNITKQKLVLNNFEKYIGNLDSICEEDLDYKAHVLICDFIYENVNFDSRYFKLKTLKI